MIYTGEMCLYQSEKQNDRFVAVTERTSTPYPTIDNDRRGREW